MTTTPTSPAVHTEEDDGVLVITIDRPELRNADGTFSAGMDLKAFTAGDTPVLPGRGFAGLTRREIRTPLIAAVKGWALGGGAEMALACDLIVAAQDATFGQPEVRYALVPPEGGIVRLPERVPRNIAMESSSAASPSPLREPSNSAWSTTSSHPARRSAKPWNWSTASPATPHCPSRPPNARSASGPPATIGTPSPSKIRSSPPSCPPATRKTEPTPWPKTPTPLARPLTRSARTTSRRRRPRICAVTTPCPGLPPHLNPMPRPGPSGGKVQKGIRHD